MVITRGQLLKTIDKGLIEEAIRNAECRSSGEICVSVSRLFWGDVEKAAQNAFNRLGMTRTRQRNGVLFFVVPARRKFVVLGDEGIHQKVGQQFWQAVASAMSEKFHAGDYTGGLVKGIETVGEQLATHFPFDPATDRNELSNVVDFGNHGNK
jgi:uncharacterized membrane protein